MAAGSLIGRIALVTGSASGIGRSVCQLFAKQGATVVAVDVQEKANMETLASLLPGNNHCALTADISKPASVNELFEKIKDSFSAAPTVVVNSAGIIRDNLLVRATEENFDEVIAVNLKGTYLVTQAAAKMMLSEKVDCGSIVNVSSIVGKGGNIGQCNYAASKAGVIGLTKSASKELSRFNIRVNAVLPGFINTPMTDWVPEKVLQGIMKLIPMRKLGQPEDIAEACLFLASKNSAYITGACLEVTGGLNI